MTPGAYLRLAAACAAVLCLSGVARGAAPDKKIIQFGWGLPDTAYLRQHIAEMEQLPFDGVVLRMFGVRDGERVEGFQVFQRAMWRREWFAECILDLRATRFSRFTDNYLLAWVTPAEFDWWSDDDWRAVCNNIALQAWVAKQGGLKGICFDPEPYGQHDPWRYPAQRHADRYDFYQYGEQVRRRGAEFMSDIAREYPDITLFMLFGAGGVGGAQSGGLLPPETEAASYGLLGFFLDGMLDALPAGAYIIDGHEGGYYLEQRVDFLEAYLRVKQHALRMISPRNHDKYRAQVLMGFGLYPDRAWRDEGWGWHVDDPERNYYPPHKFRDNLANALEVSESLVWVYTEALNWWTGEGVPPGYEEAIRAVRWESRAGDLASLVARHRVSDEQLVAYLPVEWRFRKDDTGQGVTEGWYGLDYDDAGWGVVRSDRQWCDQEAYRDMTGNGWGRAWFEVPAAAAGKRLYLLIGALDERGDIYLNGQLVHQRRPTMSGGWRLPFMFEVTAAVRPGARNLIAVHAMADTTLGGVWRPSALLAGVEP